jgi:hypothetical protein
MCTCMHACMRIYAYVCVFIHIFFARNQRNRRCQEWENKKGFSCTLSRVTSLAIIQVSYIWTACRPRPGLSHLILPSMEAGPPGVTEPTKNAPSWTCSWSPTPALAMFLAARRLQHKKIFTQYIVDVFGRTLFPGKNLESHSCFIKQKTRERYSFKNKLKVQRVNIAHALIVHGLKAWPDHEFRIHSQGTFFLLLWEDNVNA